MYIYRHYELPAIYLWPERPSLESNGQRIGETSGINGRNSAVLHIEGAQAMGLPIPAPDRWIKVSFKEEERGSV